MVINSKGLWLKRKLLKYPSRFIFCLAMIVLFSGCYREYKEVDEALNTIFEDKITKISISTLPIPQGPFKNLEITDSENIKILVDYFEAIHTIKTRKNPDLYFGGMSYLLVFQVDGNNTIEVNFDGAMFIMINEHVKEVGYKEAIAFDNVVGNIILGQYHNNKEKKSISGKIIEIYNKNKNRTCVIDTSNDKIDISYSYIFDTVKGIGWSNLRKGDQVEIYLQDNTKNAEAVFIIKR